MKKLVIKTICITLASLIGAFVLAFGAVTLFAPKCLGELFDGVGNYSASVFFYEKQYEKTDDINDLYRLVSKIDIEKDATVAEKYYFEFISHKDFESLCANIDNDNRAVLAKDYYYGTYCLALAKNGKLDKALSFAKTYVDENGYTINNPFRVIVMEYADDCNAEEIQKIKTALNLIVDDGEYLTADKNYIENK